VSAYEHDRRDPSIATLRRLLRAAFTDLELRTSTLTVGEVAQDGAPLTAMTERTRGRRLVDALLLADAIPTRPRGALRFPHISSR